jgi:diaminohydroxyphosphoribosylaminopyrimidine deaminase/5-amino-6-(5-phosphoribosylamino)uracil reductase
VDKLLCFIAPTVLGGQSPLPLVGGEGFVRLDRSLPLRFASIEQIGEDLFVEAYVSERKGAADTTH